MTKPHEDLAKPTSDLTREEEREGRCEWWGEKDEEGNKDEQKEELKRWKKRRENNRGSAKSKGWRMTRV